MASNPPAPVARLHLHGAAGWSLGEGGLHPLERKHAALLAYLWLEGPTPRSRMAGLLWPDVPEERARGNLRQRLLKLRKEAGEVVRDDDGVLSLARHVTVMPADPPGAALLQALQFDDCEALTRWLEGRRDAERERRKREWLAEVREAAQGQRLDDALYAADQLLQADRESEEAYRTLMEVYYLRGDHAAAISAWDRCREMLRELYGVPPSAATQQLGQTLLEAARSAQALQDDWGAGPDAARLLPATVLRPPRLIGREPAWRALHQGWQEGHGLCVAGEAGVGKSRLLFDWAASVGRCVVALARPGDAVLPYASLSRLLLAALDIHALDLSTPRARRASRLLPRLAERAGHPAEPVRTEYERTQAVWAVGELLADCMRSGCSCFVLDDLQFADAASIAALRVIAEPAVVPEGAVARDPAEAHEDAIGLRFAFGLRPDEAGPEVEALLASFAATGQWTSVALDRLSADEAHALLACLGIPALDLDAWSLPIWRQVGGNPAFLLESVKLLLSTGARPAAADGALPLPASIEAVIQRRIGLLTPQARHLAQLAAIAGNGYSIGLAAAALACTPLALGEPLRELELRQVFYGRQFVHDVIASVTERSVPAAVAEFMHRFVAEYLVREGGDPAHVATHWQACGEWRLAGASFVQAARAARAAALANEHAALLDRAIQAFEAAVERDPSAQAALFDALDERTGAYESQGHEGLRPQLIERLQALASTEAQRLSALNHHYGWLTNIAQPVDEAEAAAAIERARAAARPDLAWEISRMLGWQWAMSDRAQAALDLLNLHEPWVEAEADLETRASYRLARANILAFGDRLGEAIAEAERALQASTADQDWPNALPAMNNLGVMHYWRGEYDAAHTLLAQARERRERLYGSGGAGLKIDIQLGAVLYERGEHAAAGALLHGALAALSRMPDNEYNRMDRLLAENHLAQMHIALGDSAAAAAALAGVTAGVADRWVGRRLALRLRWQRRFGHIDTALRDQLQAIVARLASPFNRVLMELELLRDTEPDSALAEYTRLHDTPPVVERPGLQLHVAARAAAAAFAAGQLALAQRWAARARSLGERCAPFDLSASELAQCLAFAPAPVPAPAAQRRPAPAG